MDRQMDRQTYRYSMLEIETWTPPCVRHQFGVFLLATTASTNSPITRRWIGSHTGSRLRYVQGRLLQSAAGRSTKVSYRQVAAGHEMLQRELWAARRSTTTAWHTCFTLSCNGSMWQIESHASLGWRCTSACMARHRIICWSLKLLNDSIFVLPATIYSLFHGFSSIRTAVAPSLSLDQRHETCSKTICVTCKLNVFVIHWRRFFLISTRHIEHIRGAFCDDALYKLTFTLHYIQQRDSQTQRDRQTYKETY